MTVERAVETVVRQARETGAMRIWLLRAAWVTLPITAGPALSAGLSHWSDGARLVAGGLCWIAWAAGLLATLAPRPAALTVLRAVAPAALVVAVIAALGGRASSLASLGAVAAMIVAAALAADSEIAIAAANAVAYGDERRYPLRTPPALFVGPLPAARLVAVGGLVAGPLLLADGRLLSGVVALVIGVPLAVLAARALHGLSRRWLVLVPAGVVVVDPLALADNVLFPREHVQLLRAFDADEEPGDALDLRLGATVGSVLLRFDEPAELTRAVRARRGGDTVDAPGLVIAVSRREVALADAARRRAAGVVREAAGGSDRP
ncbi:MAG TPA: hypothetical protein VLV81_04210 [Acidimicrobiia bacterium]|nr:hypothetical protein [Acidimicrobiia bacterium]